MNRRLYSVEGDQPVFFLGADQLGRDLLSRIIYASRVSLFVGFGGVIISFFLGILLGGISGFSGGVVDITIQRIIELLMCMPQIPYGWRSPRLFLLNGLAYRLTLPSH